VIMALPTPVLAVEHVTSYFNQPEGDWIDPRGVLPYDLPRRPGIPAPGDWMPVKRKGTRVCGFCDCTLESAGDRWVDATIGGTYDICPERYDELTDTHGSHWPGEESA